MAADEEGAKLLSEVKSYLQVSLTCEGSEGTTFPRLLKAFREDHSKDLSHFAVKLGHGEGNGGVLRLLRALTDDVVVTTKGAEVFVKVVPNEKIKGNLALLDKTNKELKKEAERKARLRGTSAATVPNLIPLARVGSSSTSIPAGARVSINQNRPPPPAPPATGKQNPNMIPLGPRRAFSVNMLSDGEYEQEKYRCNQQNTYRPNASRAPPSQAAQQPHAPHQSNVYSPSRQIVRNDFGDVVHHAHQYHSTQQRTSHTPPTKPPQTRRQPSPQPVPPPVPSPNPPPSRYQPMPPAPPPPARRPSTPPPSQQQSSRQMSSEDDIGLGDHQMYMALMKQELEQQDIIMADIDMDEDYYEQDFRAPPSRPPSPPGDGMIGTAEWKEKDGEKKEETVKVKQNEKDDNKEPVKVKEEVAEESTMNGTLVVRQPEEKNDGEKEKEDDNKENEQEGEGTDTDEEEDGGASTFEFDAEFEDTDADNMECTAFLEQQNFTQIPADIHRLVTLFRRNGGTFTNTRMDALAKSYQDKFGVALNFIERNRLLDSPKNIRIVMDSFKKSAFAHTNLFQIQERGTSNYTISLQPSLTGCFVDSSVFWPKTSTTNKSVVGSSKQPSPAPSVIVKQHSPAPPPMTPPTVVRPSTPISRISNKKTTPASRQSSQQPRPSAARSSPSPAAVDVPAAMWPLRKRVIVLECPGGNLLKLQVIEYAEALADLLSDYLCLLESLGEQPIDPDVITEAHMSNRTLLVLFRDASQGLCRGRLIRPDANRYAIVEDIDTLVQRYVVRGQIFEMPDDFPFNIFPPMAFRAQIIAEGGGSSGIAEKFCDEKRPIEIDVLGPAKCSNTFLIQFC